MARGYYLITAQNRFAYGLACCGCSSRSSSSSRYSLSSSVGFWVYTEAEERR